MTENYNPIFSYGTNNANKGYTVSLYRNAQYQYDVRNDAYGDQIIGVPNSFNPYEWHHYVSSYDGATAKLYVDGVLVNRTPKSTWDTDATNFYLGSFFWRQH